MPSGSQVVSDNAQAAATPGFFTNVLGSLAGGVRGLIDLELRERAASIPDQADVREAIPAADASQPTKPGLGDVFRNLSGGQIAGLGVAAVLTWALVTGKFS